MVMYLQKSTTPFTSDNQLVAHGPNPARQIVQLGPRPDSKIVRMKKGIKIPLFFSKTILTIF